MYKTSSSFTSTSIVFSLFLFAFFLVPKIGTGQDLLTSRRSSYYTFICRLDNEDTEKLLKKYRIDFNERLLQTVIDSFPTDSQYTRELPPGNYLFVHTAQNQIKYRYLNISSFDVIILSNNRDLIIEVYDKETNAIISGANLKINNRKINFDEKTQTYILPKQRKEGFLRVQYDGETLFREIYGERLREMGLVYNIAYGFPLKYVVIPVRKLVNQIRYNDRNSNRKYYKTSAKGYIAFNKPKYLPTDTVKLKAFLVTKKGKAINKKVKLLLKEDRYNDDFTELAELSPSPNGSYIYEFPVSDTMMIDRHYTISIVDAKSGKQLLFDDFKIEDYQLDEISYEFRSVKDLYRKGEPMVFYASGKDANDLNVLDGDVEITIKPNWIKGFYGESVFVPNVLWEHRQKLDPIGETKIAVPDNVFPDAHFSITVRAKFKNSNNEIHIESLWLDYDGKDNAFDVAIKEGKIHCNLLEGYKGTYKDGTVRGLRNGEQLFARPVCFPFEEKINTRVSEYVFNTGDFTQTFDPSSIEDSISTYFYQEGDSVFFGLYNPNNIEVRYNIYKGANTEIERGVCMQLDRAFYNPQKESYHISYQYEWAGSIENVNNDVYVFDKSLKVEIDQPENIDPGQKVKVEINVNDVDNKPIEGVNLTAGAVTAKFRETAYPDLPYLGKSKKRRKYFNSFVEFEPERNATTKLNPLFRAKYKVDTIPWYKLMYPENGIYSNYDSTGTDNAQFFVHLRNGNYSETAKMIYVDSTLKYYYRAGNSRSGYSIIGNEGYHQIKIRTRKKVYVIDSVLFKKGFKLDLSLDINSLPENVKVEKTDFRLSDNEKDLLEQNMIWVKNNFYGTPAYIWQGEKVYSFTRHESEKSFLLGPFENDSVHFALRDDFQKAFSPRFGKEYSIWRDSIKTNKPFVSDNFNWNNYFAGGRINPGNLAFPSSAIQLKTEKTKWDGIKYSSNYSSSNEKVGELRFKYVGDSTFALIRLVKYTKAFKPFYYKRGTSSIRPISEGFYQLSLITPYDNVLVVDSIYVKPNGINYIRFGDNNPFISDPLIGLFGSNWNDMMPSVNLISKSTNPNGDCTITGTVMDMETGEPIPFANVTLESYGALVSGGTSDFDGNYRIGSVDPGLYALKATFVGYKVFVLENIRLAGGKEHLLDIDMESDGLALEEFYVMAYKIPLIDRDETVSGAAVTSGVFGKLSGVVAGVEVRNPLNNLDSKIGDVVFENPLNVQREKSFPISTIRKNFKDYAYWQPDLITDKNGHASFEVRFPDDITKWKTFVLAMDGEKHSGLGLAETRVMKSLVANLALPRFFIEGDESTVIGKVLNYRDNPEKVNTSFYVDDDLVKSNDTLVTNALFESFPVRVESGDTLALKYMMENDTGISDGEERKIPVLPVGAEETKGQFFVLENDTTIFIPYDTAFGQIEIHAENSTTGFMLNEIEKLKGYPHSCMEQTASKLRGYMAEEKIRKLTNEKFSNRNQIWKMIRKLEKGQHKNGSWGWWPNSKENIWMTTYVSSALVEAGETGYPSNVLFKTAQYLLWELDITENPELLNILDALSDMSEKIHYKTYIEKLESDSLSLHELLVLTRIKQKNNLGYSLKKILEMKKETAFGNYYWGNENSIYSDNSIDLTILAYKTIEASDSLHPALEKIRRYLINQSGKKRRINTYQTASMMQAILPGALREGKKLFVIPELEIIGKETARVSDFPFSKKMEGGRKGTQILKSGSSPVYFTWYSRFWNKEPKANDSIFKIDSWFETKGKKSETLEAGENVTMLVKIKVAIKANYIMLEIPVPAGCSYGNNKSVSRYNESHREYFKDKTIIYCETLEPGEHIFKINLQARFSGSYTLNPAKLELMYFPTFYGRNSIRKVNVESVVR